MKTEILKELNSRLDDDKLIDIDYVMSIIDKFGLYAIECVGKDEPEKIKGLFGEMVAVPENIIRNEFRKYLRDKLRKELFK